MADRTEFNAEQPHIVAELRECADAIQRGIDSFLRDFETNYVYDSAKLSGLTPHDMRDTSGRPMLADLYTTKANVLIALARIEGLA